MVSPVSPPEALIELLGWLEGQGFRLVSDMSYPESFGNRAIVLERSPIEVSILRDRSIWSIEIASPGLSRRALDVWKAYIEGREVRIEPDEVEWQCDFLRQHLDDIRRALAPQALETTKACLDQRSDERNRRVATPAPVTPWSLDVRPREGVRIHFGFRWREDSSFIHPIVTVANDSEAPFHFDASDFHVLLNRAPAAMHFRSNAIRSGQIDPGATQEVTARAWYWWNERHLKTIGLSYVSSDGESKGFNASAEWDVSEAQ